VSTSQTFSFVIGTVMETLAHKEDVLLFTFSI
jgi:hypothetical protein